MITLHRNFTVDIISMGDTTDNVPNRMVKMAHAFLLSSQAAHHAKNLGNLGQRPRASIH